MRLMTAPVTIVAGSMLLCACTFTKRQPAPAPTFTPAPSATSARPLATPPARPIVSRDCLRGLSSYRFDGSFALVPAARAQADASSGGAALSGSLANLLSNVTFQGAALAPDRYQAHITFGGSGVQPLDVIRVGDQTYSRFGDNTWQRGDQIQNFGGISQFDPQSLCESTLEFIDSGGQTPAHESINGAPALRYEISGAQLGRALGGGRPQAGIQTATPPPGAGKVTVWVAEKGNYPLRFQITTRTAAGSINLMMNITDVNGRDVQIAAPS
jgi:hypothetical protein